MTNAEKFVEVFGTDLKRQYATKSWWEQEFVAPKREKWIEERTYMECPNCHDIWHYEDNQTERFKCCPTCGERIK